MDIHERLEAEDEDERQERLGQLFMRVDQAEGNTLNATGSSATPPIAGGPTRAPIEPPIELLDRVRQFLPQLAESNASLSSRDQHELDIENISDDGPRYIEMNLGLGVFEYRRRGTHPDEGSSDSSSSPSSTSELDSEDSDSDSSGSSSCSEDGVQVAARPKKPLPKRARPNITVLNGSENLPGGSSAA